jgi:hypothetical protein
MDVRTNRKRLLSTLLVGGLAARTGGGAGSSLAFWRANPSATL